jgi:hypothetical protein
MSFIPLWWAIVGTSAARYFGVVEDYMLGVSAGAFVFVQFLSTFTPSTRMKRCIIFSRINYGNTNRPI